jgi:hypothetical protein
MQLPDVSQYNRDLNTERITFSNLRRELDTALLPFKPSDSVRHDILEHAEEFGTDRTLAKLASDPKHFGLTAKPNDPALAVLTPLVTSMRDSIEKMDAIISAREDILLKADPKRDRVFQIDGVEVVFDIPNQAVRYVGTDRTEPLMMEVVEPRAAPSPELIQTIKNGMQRDRKR